MNDAIPILTEAERSELAELLPDWTVEGEELVRDFEFVDFVEAFGFLSRVALLAEKHDHHPGYTHVYNRIRMRWTTHDAQGLTRRDVEMATRVEALLPGVP